MHLEEITDKMDASLKLSNDKPSTTPSEQHNGTPSPAPAQASQIGPTPLPIPAPALPPQLALHANKTADEILADLNKSPLFMTELEDNNQHLEALEALAYEGTPLENATDFKDRGNEAFRERRLADAREFYGRGIAIVMGEDKRREKGEPPNPENNPDGDKESEVAAQKAVLETLYVNRAACSLELQNYRACWLDCHAALQLSPRNLKAWYRSARALLAVGRTAEASDACAGGLAVDAENGPLKTIAKEVAAKQAAAQKKTAKEASERAEEVRKEGLLRTAMAERKITVRKSARPPDMGDARMEFLEDEGVVVFPAVLLYPAHYESDFIKAFREDETLMQHFGYVFPLPWDREGEYSANGVECFMETTTGGLVKVGRKVLLAKVLSMDTVEVVDGVVKIYVVPKAKSEAWVKDFKAAKAKEKERA